MNDDLLDKYMLKAIDVMKCTKIELRDDGKIDPAVGAVIVLPNGQDHSAYRGELRKGNHAEFTLIERKLANTNCAEATLFVTLEPCSPGARNLPKHSCAEWIVGARIKTVYIGIEDPDPNIAGKGIEYLLSKGIEIKSFKKAYCEEIKKINQRFIKQARTRIKKEKENMPKYDLNEVIHSKMGISILSKEALKKYSDSIGIDKNINDGIYENLEELGLVIKNKDNSYNITRDCLILFGKEPSTYMPQVCLKYYCEYFSGEIDQKTYDGPMVFAIENAIEWIKKSIPSVTNIGISRSSDLMIPERILREALINSIAHRDYSIDGAKIYIEIYPKRIVIKSPGLPQPPVTLDAMKKFEAPSFSRNPKLTYVFRKLGMMEENRLGMNTFAKMTEDYKLRLPEYNYNNPNIELTLWLERAEIVNPYDQLTPIEKNGYNELENHNNLSTVEYAQIISVSERTASRHLKKMLELGLIEKIGVSKNVSYKVRNVK